jgi:hypothetical protein
MFLEFDPFRVVFFAWQHRHCLVPVTNCVS